MTVSITTFCIKCHFAECHYAGCHKSECRYTECHYAECRGASYLASASLLSYMLPQLDLDLERMRKCQLILISGLYYKCFTIVIYDQNDIGLYYKTRDDRN